MASVITTPADLVNLALARIGVEARVGNLYEGSRVAKTALDIYSQTRDDMLRGGNWPFASRSVIATLLKSAPVTGYFPPNGWDPTQHPAQPWRYEYEYPSDCLEVRAVKPQVYFTPNFSPQPYLFAVSNDSGYTPARRVVLSNVQNAMMTYCGQVTNPSTWPPDFVEAFAAALGQRIAPALKGMEAAKFEAADGALEKGQAEKAQG